MAGYLSYTVFADLGCSQVRDVVQAHGSKARSLVQSFRNIKGYEPREGDVIAGCRIDRIGSEDAERLANDLFQEGDQRSALLVLRGEAA